MGSYEKDGVGPGRLSGKGFKKVIRDTVLPWEGWMLVLPVLGGGNDGGGDRADSDINSLEA